MGLGFRCFSVFSMSGFIAMYWVYDFGSNAGFNAVFASRVSEWEVWHL